MAPAKRPVKNRPLRTPSVANGRVNGRGDSHGASRSAASGDTSIVKQLLPSETKIVEWIIPKFRRRLDATDAGSDVSELLITAGESINLKTKWNICVQSNRAPSGFGIYMRLNDAVRMGQSGGGKVFACFQMSLVKPTGDLCETEDFEMREWIPSTQLDGFESWGEFLTTEKVLENGIARSVDDPLKIQIKLVLFGHTNPSENNDDIGGGNELGRIKQAWGDLLISSFHHMSQTESFPDVELSVKPNLLGSRYITIKAHKAMLASGSFLFKDMFEGTVPVRKEGGAFVIEDMNEETLRMMLQFIYTGSINPKWNAVGLELLAAAEKYELTLLSKYILNHLGNLVDNCSDDEAKRMLKTAKDEGRLDVAKRIAKKLKARIDALLND